MPSPSKPVGSVRYRVERKSSLLTRSPDEPLALARCLVTSCQSVSTQGQSKRDTFTTLNASHPTTLKNLATVFCPLEVDGFFVYLLNVCSREIDAVLRRIPGKKKSTNHVLFQRGFRSHPLLLSQTKQSRRTRCLRPFFSTRRACLRFCSTAMLACFLFRSCSLG